ncbi:branched-chain amino acid ABC transporter permease [Bradyrhizobium jicamae]|uniref:branched-chain amino acid ABC transporter permease n=1 Tax=Bradyrhizobium jicamae TaxID=280332 RepID=UPI001BAB9CED|nr:branched-chain amino acid ABC transporter permease [Bradyrhizobium jicamae]MBR0752181.1 branched-chain amino acid ABC transporter permease [Bradyrhizobium jicamae]
MTGIHRDEMLGLICGGVALALLSLLPLLTEGFYLSFGVNLVLYAALSTAWSLFSGPTRFVSLASAAFFGIGTYSVALWLDALPFVVLIAIAALASAALAALIGAATLRLSGVYFVIFTLGLTELIRQIVSWSQSRFAHKMGLYVFTDFTEGDLYWMLLALTAATFSVGWLINRSRLGFALRIIGDDETVARHVGIATARAKIVLFMISGAFAGIAGAIMAPRYAYIEPQAAFNPMISFMVVIMALLGGTRRLWGPLVGVVPFTVVMELIAARFPNESLIVVGIAFLAIVYVLPSGVTGRIECLRERLRRSLGTGVDAPGCGKIEGRA